MNTSGIAGLISQLVLYDFIISSPCVHGETGKGEGSPQPYKALALNPIELGILVQSEFRFVEKVQDLSETQVLPANVLIAALKYVWDFKDTVMHLKDFAHKEYDERIKAVTKNPIATYRCLWRYANRLPELKEKLREIENSSVLLGIPPSLTVNDDDVVDTALGLLRIQYVYDFSPKQIAEGVISGVETGVKLNALLCYELGTVASRHYFHTLSIEWLEVALSKAPDDHTVDTSLIQSALESSAERHDELFDGRWEFDAHFYDSKVSTIRLLNNFSLIRRPQRQLLAKRLTEDENSEFGYARFWELCSKGSSQTQKNGRMLKLKPLKCFYETKVYGYWTIAPIKMEMLSIQPDIYQLYDVLPDSKIRLMKNAVTTSLERSRVDNLEEPGTTKVAYYRTSVGTFIDELNHPGLEGIPDLIQHATGLKVRGQTAAEHLQVAAYTFGGHYDIHMDYLDTGPTDVRGGRIATFMFYLSEPELGGYTVFTKAGIAARPVKGSAVVWHNVLSDGSPDYGTYHGACPVVLGEKWVANKWIGINAQFIVRKCSLERSKALEFPYLFNE